LTTEEIRSEKIKVLRALRPVEKDQVDENFVRGQYGEGSILDEKVPAYQHEAEELAASNTETFVAGRVMIDNYRWAGVPFYIRTGKRMTDKSTKIVVEFKEDRKSTRLNSSHVSISYAVFCLKKKKKKQR